MGGGFLYLLFLSPVIQIANAKKWVEVPCTITKSQVESHSGDDSETYSIEINFKYQFDSRWYEGGQYSFNFGSSSGFQGKNEVVMQYPVGLKSVCYVDPKNPQSAVINRGYFDDLWFSLIPLLFLLIGVFGLFFTLRSKSIKGEANFKKTFGHNKMPTPNQIIENKSDHFFHNEKIINESSGWLGFIFMFVFTSFWLGIVCFAASITAESGSPRVILFVIFSDFLLLIFGSIGILLIFLCLYLLLKQFNPKFVVELYSSKINLGDEFKFKITSKGNINKINKVTVSFMGIESARYSIGTNTKTETHTFFEYQLPVNGALDRFLGSTITIKIPADKMHSFTSYHNSIEWKIIFTGEIPMNPDIRAEFIIKVGPK